MSGDVNKGTTRQVDGQSALELKTTGKLYTGRLYVSATGQPYPVRLEKHGRETAQFTFTDWNATPAPTAPTTTVSGG